MRHPCLIIPHYGAGEGSVAGHGRGRSGVRHRCLTLLMEFKGGERVKPGLSPLTPRKGGEQARPKLKIA